MGEHERVWEAASWEMQRGVASFEAVVMSPRRRLNRVLRLAEIEGVHFLWTGAWCEGQRRLAVGVLLWREAAATLAACCQRVWAD